MRSLIIFALVLLIAPAAVAQGVNVQSIKGEVSVRHGVAESWSTVAVGDILKSDDSMKTGPNGSAVLVARFAGPEGETSKRIALPSDVLVDISDIRQLSPEELMLKLTMEKVRSSSYEWKNNDLRIPNATVVHGEDRTAGAVTGQNGTETGTLQMNGARVLFENGFYSTCALRAMETFRRYPATYALFDNRFMVAQSLEKANLRGEALAEYGTLSRMEGLTQQQKTAVEVRMRELR